MSASYVVKSGRMSIPLGSESLITPKLTQSKRNHFHQGGVYSSVSAIHTERCKIKDSEQNNSSIK